MNHKNTKIFFIILFANFANYRTIFKWLFWNINKKYFKIYFLIKWEVFSFHFLIASCIILSQ